MDRSIEVTNFNMNIKDNLANVIERIGEAAYKSGRNPHEINLVAVTKNVDSNIIMKSIDLGVTNIGENRVQEFRAKYDTIAKPVNWHFIGNLQSNKVKYIVDKVDLVHSLDRSSLAKELNKRGKGIDRIVPVLVQVNISKESTKSGIFEEEIFSFMDSIADFKYIEIKGLMTIAPHTTNIESVRPYFSRMRELFEKVKDQQYKNVDMKYLSMGMTNDFEVAIEEGANIVRVGRAIFGNRV